MNHAPIMGMLHGVAHPGHQFQPRGRIQKTTAGVIVERHAADELHGEIRPAIFDKSRVVNLCDPRVLQPPEDLGLMIEPLGVLERHEARADDLKRDGAARLSCSAS